jgi:hypothetical protein
MAMVKTLSKDMLKLKGYSINGHCSAYVELWDHKKEKVVRISYKNFPLIGQLCKERETVAEDILRRELRKLLGLS